MGGGRPADPVRAEPSCPPSVLGEIPRRGGHLFLLLSARTTPRQFRITQTISTTSRTPGAIAAQLDRSGGDPLPALRTGLNLLDYTVQSQMRAPGDVLHSRWRPFRVQFRESGAKLARRRKLNPKHAYFESRSRPRNGDRTA
jgi:hypothetical protein